MPNRLIAPSRIPYGGQYVLNLPERGMVGHGNNFEALLRSIKEWRRANSVPIGLGFDDEVEQAVCEKYAVECQAPPHGKPRVIRLSLSNVLQGTKVLLAFKLAGSPYVDQSEAERRASICAICPMNVDYAKPCGGNCGGLKEIVTTIVGGRKTSLNDRLKACSICGCVNAAHLLIPLDILAKGVTPEQQVQFSQVQNCWKQIQPISTSSD
jgi:hypothetical protein